MVALKRIIPEIPVRKTALQEAVDSIATATLMTLHCVRALAERKDQLKTFTDLRMALDQLFEESWAVARNVSVKEVRKSIKKGLPCEDGKILELIPEIMACVYTVNFDETASIDTRDFISIHTFSYLQQFKSQLTPQDIMDVCDAMIKRFGQAVGMVLAAYSMTEPDADNALQQLIKKYSQGI